MMRNRQLLHCLTWVIKHLNVRKFPVTGDSGYATMLLGAEGMFLSGFISEHDLKIAKKLAFVLSGGKVPYGTLVDEQYMLDLEREAFLSLVAEPKSQQRMQHMLVKGKPLAQLKFDISIAKRRKFNA